MVGGEPPVSAYTGPAFPVIQVSVNEGGGQVQGWGWTEDTTVEVFVAGVSNGTTSAPSGNFTFGLTTRPTLGQQVKVLGNTGYFRTVDIIDLKVGHFDIPNSTLSGTKG